jgi:AraC-like DNA-binding protein
MPRDQRARAPDPLSDVLDMLQLRGDVYARTEAASPWAIAFPRGEARFHFVERGAVWIRVEGVSQAVRVGEGDLVVLPHGEAHALGDAPDTHPTPLFDLLKAVEHDEDVFRVGHGSPDVVLSCGRFHLNPVGRASPLAMLPALLVIENPGGSGAPEPYELVLRLFRREVLGRSVGNVIASARLVDLLLVYAIRAWMDEHGESVDGWLGAMRDPKVGEALARIHASPQKAWSVTQLAAAVGMSRSSFAARFTELCGVPPLRYLIRWRMQLADRMLREGKSVREAGEAVGYESEAAFSRLFKKHHGETPVRRRGARVAFVEGAAGAARNERRQRG